MAKPKDTIYRRLSPVGKAAHQLRVVKLYIYQRNYGFILNWWNPLAYLTCLFFVMYLFWEEGHYGVKEEWRKTRLAWKLSSHIDKDKVEYY